MLVITNEMKQSLAVIPTPVEEFLKVCFGWELKKNKYYDSILISEWYRSQVERRRSAKPTCVGAIPTGTSKSASLQRIFCLLK